MAAKNVGATKMSNNSENSRNPIIKKITQNDRTECEKYIYEIYDILKRINILNNSTRRARIKLKYLLNVARVILHKEN